MDPTACLKRILEALFDGDEEEALEATEDLLTWLKKGGFPPDFSALSDDEQLRVATIFCHGLPNFYTDGSKWNTLLRG